MDERHLKMMNENEKLCKNEQRKFFKACKDNEKTVEECKYLINFILFNSKRMERLTKKAKIWTELWKIIVCCNLGRTE